METNNQSLQRHFITVIEIPISTFGLENLRISDFEVITTRISYSCYIYYIWWISSDPNCESISCINKKSCVVTRWFEICRMRNVHVGYDIWSGYYCLVSLNFLIVINRKLIQIKIIYFVLKTWMIFSYWRFLSPFRNFTLRLMRIDPSTLRNNKSLLQRQALWIEKNKIDV